MLCPSPFALSELELATGLVFGQDRSSVPAAPRGVPGDPLVALEQAVLPALLRPPCVVSFSGGRDSSVVLAVATAVARREGLAPPIPATNVFPGAANAEESEWQEQVIAHVGLREWARLDLHDELDCVGPLAQQTLLRHGLLWPFNTHFHAPLLELATGGSLLTGIGGDELLGTSEWARAAAVLSRSARPTPRDARRIALALAPRAVRAAYLRRREGGLPWLTPSGTIALRSTMARDLAGEPLRWSRRWPWWMSTRHVAIGFRSLDLIAVDQGATIVHPFADRAFAQSAARFAATHRLYERTRLLRGLFGGILPAHVLERSSKASFNEVFWGPASSDFARGAFDALEDLDLGVVDRAGLRSVWAEQVPDAHSFLLLQALWLRDARRADGH